MYYLLILVISMLGVPSVGWAAIDCADAGAVEHVSGAPSDPTDISYTVPSGSNQVTIVGVALRDVGNDSVPTITGAGGSFTQLGGYVDQGNIHTSFWYRKAPTQGATTVSLTYSEGILAIGVVVWTCNGVDQTTSFGTPATAIGTGTAVSVTVTDDPNDVTVDIFGGDQIAANPTVGADQTTIHLGTDGAEVGYGASYQSGDGGVMSWTRDSAGTQDWATFGVALKPAAATQRPQFPILLNWLWELMSPAEAYAY